MLTYIGLLKASKLQRNVSKILNLDELLQYVPDMHDSLRYVDWSIYILWEI